MKIVQSIVGIAFACGPLCLFAQTTTDQDAFCNDMGQRTAENCSRAGGAQSNCQFSGQEADNDCRQHQAQHNAAYPGAKQYGTGKVTGVQ